jgi:transposase
VSTIRKNLRLFGTPGAPSVHVGCPPTVTPYMTEVLLEHLDKQPGIYLNEMVAILHYQCGSWVSEDRVQRTLAREGWTKKQMRQKAQEQNPRLRAFYQRKLSKFQSHQLQWMDGWMDAFIYPDLSH